MPAVPKTTWRIEGYLSQKQFEGKYLKEEFGQNPTYNSPSNVFVYLRIIPNLLSKVSRFQTTPVIAISRHEMVNTPGGGGGGALSTVQRGGGRTRGYVFRGRMGLF